ncbi:hypothetical protein BRD03_03055 [Halobacteriales archaeon QS_9_68_17]|nr:MAG: hypothetical protein BRD03_03055 [Halobacteriales archaeon QS_9_68_17]
MDDGLSPPANTTRERSDESRMQFRLLITGNRWAVVALVLLVGPAVVGSSSMRRFPGTDAIGTLFGSTIVAVVTAVTFVLTVSRTVLSQELRVVGDVRERMGEGITVRRDLEDLSAVGVTPRTVRRALRRHRGYQRPRGVPRRRREPGRDRRRRRDLRQRGRRSRRGGHRRPSLRSTVSRPGPRVRQIEVPPVGVRQPLAGDAVQRDARPRALHVHAAGLRRRGGHRDDAPSRERLSRRRARVHAGAVSGRRPARVPASDADADDADAGGRSVHPALDAAAERRGPADPTERRGDGGAPGGRRYAFHRPAESSAMRLLFVHADRAAFEATTTADEGGAERDDAPLSGEMDDCVAAFVAVDTEDAAAVDAAADGAADELRAAADRLNAARIAMYPCPLLSDDAADAETAAAVLGATEAALSGYEVLRAPAGWHLAFDVSCKGHPLSAFARRVRASRDGGARPPSERALLTPDGERRDPVGGSPDVGEELRSVIGHETAESGAAGRRDAGDGGRRWRAAADRLADWGFVTDDDSVEGLHWTPRGAVVRDCLRAYVDDRAAALGAPPVETPELLDPGVRDVRVREDPDGDGGRYRVEAGDRR